VRAWLEASKVTSGPLLRPITKGGRIGTDRLAACLPFLDTYRTLCRAPEPAFRRVLEQIREIQLAA
jgi:hypothetical protein